MAAKKYKLNFTMTDGSERSVEFDAPQGPQGEKGDQGEGVFAFTFRGNETCPVTAEEIYAAVEAGNVCVAIDNIIGRTYVYHGKAAYNEDASYSVPTFVQPTIMGTDSVDFRYMQIDPNGVARNFHHADVRIASPRKLFFVGAVNKTYDGSQEVTIRIPTESGGSGTVSSDDIFVVRFSHSDGTADKTQAEINEAVSGGKVCIALDASGHVYVYAGVQHGNSDATLRVPTFVDNANYDEDGTLVIEYVQFYSDGTVETFYREANLSGTGGGSGLPEPAGPHMALVTDSDGNVSWKEQLAYEYGITAEIIPESEVVIAEADLDGVVIGLIETEPSQALVAEKKYIVTWNGVEYECTAQVFEEDGIVTAMVGNASLMEGTGNSGEPFIIIYAPPEMTGEDFYFFVYILDGSTENKVKIAEDDTFVKPIDKKYLGELRGQKKIVLTPNEDKISFTASCSFAEAWAMDEGELQNAICIESEYSREAVYAVSKIVAGDIRAIQMVCMGFNDYEHFETPILQWYASNGRFVGVYSQRGLMPKNNSYEEAIPVLDAESGYANAIPLSEVKERLDIAPFIVTIEHTADGYTADHYQDEIIAAYESGRVVYAMLSTAIFQLSGYSTTQGCNFVLLDAFEEMGETLPWMMRFVITTDSVLFETNTLLTASDKTEIKQELVSLSEEIAELKGESGTVTKNVSVTYSTDGYVHWSEKSIKPANGYQVSDAIVVHAGETISFESYVPDASVVAVLSRWNEDCSKCLAVIACSAAETQQVEYTATQSVEYLRITHNTREGYTQVYSAKITSEGGNPIVDRVAKLEKTCDALKNPLYDCMPFIRIGVVGDSLASGASNFTNSAGNATCADRPEYSWGKYMEREHGVEVKLFTQGGTSTRTWLTRSTCLAAMQAAEACDCCIIGLGVNDQYSLGNDYLGSSADVTVGSEDGNADTFYGNYSKIIASLLAKSPRCKIFCLTMPKKQGQTAIAFNVAIRDLVGMYDNAHLIDLENDDFYSGEQYTSTWNGAHSTAPGYKIMAEHLWKRMNEYIMENMSSFTDVQWILENHD